MKRFLMISVAAASLAFAAPSPARAADVGFSIRIGDPYRGASLYFRSEPDVVMIPRSRVYYVRNYDRDLYRYGSWWYLIDDGYWYRARSYRGPFVRVALRSVPRDVYSVPTRYRRRWGTPSHYGRNWDNDWRWEQDRDRRYNVRYRDRDRSQVRDRDWRDRDTRDRDRNRNWDWDRNRDRDGNRDRDRDGNRSRDFIDRNNDGVDDRDQNNDRERWRDRGDNDRDNNRDDNRDNDRDNDGNWRDR